MSITLVCVLMTLLPAADYPSANLLIEANEMAKPDFLRRVRILDARGHSKFFESRIPGAAWVDTATWTKDFARSTDPELWSKHLSRAQIDDLKKPIAIYADDVRDAARVWWILRYWGAADVRLLNGGWAAWQAARGPVEKELEAAVAAVEMKLTPQKERLADKAFMLDALKNKSHLLLDVRSKEEHCGEAETAKRNGTIPGAVHLEWSEVLDPKTKKFKSPEELKALFKSAGVDPTRPTATYCQSGGRAAVMAFALELMSGKDVRNYYRSWAEWGNADDTPVVKPK